jgi:hypothetical protein
VDPITIALLAVKGAVGIGKAIAGGIQKRRAAKELDKQTPQYSRPEEYSKILSIFQQQAGLSELPGQSATEEKLSAATARGTRAVGKYADNPVAAVAATAGLYGKEQGAIRDLGIQFAQFKNKAQSQLAGAYEMGANYSDKEFSYNQWYPDQMRRNVAAQKWNGGQQNLWGGLDQVAGAGLDFATANLGALSGKAGTPGVNTTPNQTSWLQGNANAASVPNNLAASAVNPGTVTDFSSLYNPTYAGQFIPNLGTPVPSSYYNGK